MLQRHDDDARELDSSERRALRGAPQAYRQVMDGEKSRFASFALVSGGCSDSGIEKPATTGTAQP